MTTTLITGCFDILHPGHIYILKEASKFNDQLYVGLNSDESIKKLKGNSRPINDFWYRFKVLSGIKYVNNIFKIEETPERLIHILKPNTIVVGGDYTPEKIICRKYVLSYGGRVEVIPRLEEFSTTSVIKKFMHSSGTL
jgi:D-beta-D-heptose 7-phosphate kinase/D-beta-D-heptose 1-phosphate adenosyltransferase